MSSTRNEQLMIPGFEKGEFGGAAKMVLQQHNIVRELHDPRPITIAPITRKLDFLACTYPPFLRAQDDSHLSCDSYRFKLLEYGTLAIGRYF